MESAAFLESVINEFLADVYDGQESYLGQISTDHRRKLGEHWDRAERGERPQRESALDKYNSALKISRQGTERRLR